MTTKNRGVAMCGVMALCGGAGALGGVQPDGFVPGQVVVRVEDECNAEAVLAGYPVVVLAVVEGGSRPYYLLGLPEGAGVFEYINILEDDDCIKDAEPNFEVGDPDPGTQDFFFGSTSPEFWSQPAIDILDLRHPPQFEGPVSPPTTDVIVAIVDTGVDASHPLLAGAAVLGGYAFVSCSGGDVPCDTGPGESIDQVGVGLVGGHGTFVAGLVHLVAPEAAILPIKVMEPGGVSSGFQVAQGMQAAIDFSLLPENAGKRMVINVSLGTTSPADPIADMIEVAQLNNILVVASAGNDGVEAKRYPAGFTTGGDAVPGGVVAVGATGNDDTLAAFSNYGSWLTLTAPGVDVKSITPGQFSASSGSSFSTAIVTGAVARARGYAPQLAPQQLVNVLKDSCDPVVLAGPELAGKVGAGRLNIGTLMAAVGGEAPLVSGDLDGSGVVDSGDLNMVLAVFGASSAIGDLTGDGLVGSEDLNQILAGFGGQ